MSNLFSRYWPIWALLSGALLPFSLSPYDLPYLALLSLGVLYGLVMLQTGKRAAWSGYLFGLGYFGSGLWWTYISIHDNGGGDPVSSVLLVALLAAALALFILLVSGLMAQIRSQPVWVRVVLATWIWVAVEWLRGFWFFNGYPWLHSGYGQINTPLAGYVPLLGVYGLSFMLALTAFLLVEAAIRRVTWHWPLALLLTVWGGGLALQQVQWTQPNGQPIRVTVLQGNISQTQKWQPENKFNTLKLYFEMTEAHWDDSDVIIWPETAIPAFYDQIKGKFIDPMLQLAQEHKVDLVVGLPYIDSNKAYYNSVLRLGEPPQFYHKQHLLPFGEYLPWQPLSGWVLDQLQIPLGDFARGASDQPLLVAGGQPFVTTICYEDVFGQEVIRQAEKAAFLVNMTNDAWFGDSAQPHQHLQMSQMRALETGRYMVRATNTGVTGFIGPDGKVIAQLPVFTQASLTHAVQPMTGVTPYMRLGDHGCFIGLTLLSGLVYLLGWLRSRSLKAA